MHPSEWKQGRGTDAEEVTGPGEMEDRGTGAGPTAVYRKKPNPDHLAGIQNGFRTINTVLARALPVVSVQFVAEMTFFVQIEPFFPVKQQ